MKKIKWFVFVMLTLCFTVFVASADEASAADMHRLYNPNSGEHFYTATTNEKNHLVKVGWKYEGIGWTAPANGSAVYRLYNANAGDHHYTMNVGEKNHLVKVGWKYEGVGWYSDTKKTVPLYRAYNPNAKAGSHNYTVNYAEQKNLIRVGWKDEGIGWYGIKKVAPTMKYTVTIKHMGSDGKMLKSTTSSVEKGKSHTAKAETFSGYTLKGSNSQTVTVNGNTTITFNYTKNATPVTKYTVTIKHMGSDGKTLKSTTASVEKGKTHTAKAETFSGYTLKGSNSQTVTVNGNTTITFNYTLNKYNVTIIHKGSDGKNLAANQVVSVDYGKPYTATARTFTGYTVSGSNKQTVTVNGNTTITFTYTVNKYNVTIIHKGNDGKNLAANQVVSVDYGKPYTATARTFTGYTLSGSNTQTVTVNGHKTITFNYTKNVVKHKVTIVHKGNDGKTLHTETVDAEQGKAYVANSKSFAGYQLKGSSAQTVTITQPTTITFNYNSLAFDRVMIHAKVDGKIIKSVTFDIKPGEKFKATTDKLKLDPDVYDVGTNWAYSEITGVGGKEINYTFTIEYFRHYLSASELTIMQQTIVQKVNELRTSLGRTPLTENLKLSAAANVRSDELRQKFAHVRPDGSSIYTAIDEQGLSVGGSRGENIAMNSNHTSGQSAGLAMFEQWKNSPGHYANMIDTDFNYIGIGVYCHGSKVYGTQLFVGNIY